jgi:hypothetical protein
VSSLKSIEVLTNHANNTAVTACYQFAFNAPLPLQAGREFLATQIV